MSTVCTKHVPSWKKPKEDEVGEYTFTREKTNNILSNKSNFKVGNEENLPPSVSESKQQYQKFTREVYVDLLKGQKQNAKDLKKDLTSVHYLREPEAEPKEIFVTTNQQIFGKPSSEVLIENKKNVKKVVSNSSNLFFNDGKEFEKNNYSTSYGDNFQKTNNDVETMKKRIKEKLEMREMNSRSNWMVGSEEDRKMTNTSLYKEEFIKKQIDPSERVTKNGATTFTNSNNIFNGGDEKTLFVESKTSEYKSRHCDPTRYDIDKSKNEVPLTNYQKNGLSPKKSTKPFSLGDEPPNYVTTQQSSFKKINHAI